MKYAGFLIDHLRRRTGNRNATSTSGVSTEQFLQYLNDAQFALQDGVLTANPDVRIWDETALISPVASTRAYTVPDYFSWGGNSVRRVEYSRNSDEDNYYTLDLANSAADLASDTNQWPAEYFVQNGQILIGSIPSSSAGSFRVTAPRRARDIELRRGQITSVAGTPSYTSITLDNDTFLTGLEGQNPTLLADADYVSVLDWHGVAIREAIPVTAYDSTTRVLTLGSGVLVSAGAIAAGQYIVIGPYAGTHLLQWPRESERFLLSWAAWKIKTEDQSVSLADEMAELDKHVQGIASRLQGLTLDTEYFSEAY